MLYKHNWEFQIHKKIIPILTCHIKKERRKYKAEIVVIVPSLKTNGELPLKWLCRGVETLRNGLYASFSQLSMHKVARDITEGKFRMGFRKNFEFVLGRVWRTCVQTTPLQNILKTNL